VDVLILADYYLPGSRAGGPIRSLANLVESLGDEFTFRLVTRDRDCGGERAYPGVEPDRWQRVGKAQVLYLSPRRTSLACWQRLLSRTPYDVLYLNSFFSSQFTIKPLLLRRLGLVPRRATVLSPKGELAASALAIKNRKKRLFATLAQRVALYRGLTWQASSAYEAADIARHWASPSPDDLLIAPDMAAPVSRQAPPPSKKPGALAAAFLSRIVPVKNLDGALSVLAEVSGDIDFTIYGPVEDTAYWASCEERIAALPPRVRVRCVGAVSPRDVPGLLCRQHLFFLPTRGENFGHAIVEALAAGCPVLIGDQTPWRNLRECQAGWDLPVDRPDLFRAALQSCIDMDEDEYRRWSHGARSYYERIIERDQSVQGHRQLFLRAARDAASVGA
jgi:glycosyltransferase involved in cell wall biosynthesis